MTLTAMVVVVVVVVAAVTTTLPHAAAPSLPSAELALSALRRVCDTPSCRGGLVDAVPAIGTLLSRHGAGHTSLCLTALTVLRRIAGAVEDRGPLLSAVVVVTALLDGTALPDGTALLDERGRRDVARHALLLLATLPVECLPEWRQAALTRTVCAVMGRGHGVSVVKPGLAVVARLAQGRSCSSVHALPAVLAVAAAHVDDVAVVELALAAMTSLCMAAAPTDAALLSECVATALAGGQSHPGDTAVATACLRALGVLAATRGGSVVMGRGNTLAVVKAIAAQHADRRNGAVVRDLADRVTARVNAPSLWTALRAFVSSVLVA